MVWFSGCCWISGFRWFLGLGVVDVLIVGLVIFVWFAVLGFVGLGGWFGCCFGICVWCCIYLHEWWVGWLGLRFDLIWFYASGWLLGGCGGCGWFRL